MVSLVRSIYQSTKGNNCSKNIKVNQTTNSSLKRGITLLRAVLLME